MTAESHANTLHSFERTGVYFLLLALTLIMAGSDWDVAWHYWVGRDSFWIAPHAVLYTGVGIAGLTALALTIPTTKWTVKQRGQIQALNFRAPTGFALAGIGTLVMISGAPFDEWWHRLFGIDISIWSPPHMMGVIGAFIIGIGTMFACVKVRDSLPKPLYEPLLLFAFVNTMRAIIFGIYPASQFTFFGATHLLQTPPLVTSNPFVVAVLLSLFATPFFIIARRVMPSWLPIAIPIALFLYSSVLGHLSESMTNLLADHLGLEFSVLFAPPPFVHYTSFTYQALLMIPASIILLLIPRFILSRTIGIVEAITFGMLLLISTQFILAMQGRLNMLYGISSFIQIAVYTTLGGLTGVWLTGKLSLPEAVNTHSTRETVTPYTVR